MVKVTNLFTKFLVLKELKKWIGSIYKKKTYWSSFSKNGKTHKANKKVTNGANNLTSLIPSKK